MQKKRILFLIDNLSSGGAQNQVVQYSIALKKNNHNVGVVTYHKSDFFLQKLKLNNISYYNIPKKNKLGLNVIWGLRKIIQQNEIKILISFMSTPNIYASLLKNLFKNELQVVISYRSKTIVENLKPVDLFLRKYCNRVSDIIICNSFHEKDTWIESFPYLDKKIFTLYNIVDIDKYIRKQNFDLKNKVLVVGRVVPLKNASILIKALGILKEKGLIIHVDWFGRKKFKSKILNQYVSNLTKEITKHDIANQWNWKEPTKDLHELYSHYDCLVHGSKIEGLPNVICEALSAGLPVLASNILDHPILLNNQKNGLSFHPDKPSSLVKSILTFYKLRSDQRKKFSDSSITYAKKSFSFTSQSKKLLEILSEKSK